MEVIIKESGNKGFSMATEEDKRAGMMSYSIASDELIIIDHTEVEQAFNGKGVGKQLLLKIVDMAREKNIKIIPLCPFAASVFKKSSDFSDVLK